jgi:hypothetical protein
MSAPQPQCLDPTASLWSLGRSHQPFTLIEPFAVVGEGARRGKCVRCPVMQ